MPCPTTCNYEDVVRLARRKENLYFTHPITSILFMKSSITLITLVAVCLLLLSFQRFSVLPGCAPYKKGTFYYHFTSQGKTFNYTVTRSDSTQTESNQLTGNSAVFKIRWSGDCFYELRFISGTETLSKELSDLKRQMVVRTKIVSGTKDYYLFESTSNLSANVLKDTV